MNRDAINQVLERCGAVMHPANKRALEQALRGAGPSQRHTVKAAQARTLVFGDLSGPERDARQSTCGPCEKNILHPSGVRICKGRCKCGVNDQSAVLPKTVQIEVIVATSWLGCVKGAF